MNIPFYTAEDIRPVLSMDNARKLLQSALLDGFDPAADPARANVTAGAGNMLFMPATVGERVGVKIVALAPDNPARGLPRVQAFYLLFDAETLSPLALMDGSLLTEVRTPAISALAADHLAASDIAHAFVFGSGPQAIAHVRAMAGIRDIQRFTMCSRNEETLGKAIAALRADGYQVEAGTADQVADAQLVVCATSACEPLFAAEQIRPGTCVVAMGAHEPTCRETPGALYADAQVVVEDIDTALREAGDVVLAQRDGYQPHLDVLADLVGGKVQRDANRVQVFKGVGMSWQDLVVAGAIYRDLQR